IIPSLRSPLKTALILCTIMGLKSSVMGEWFGAQNGIGRRINELFYSFNMVSFYAYSLLFLIVVTAFAFIFERMGEKLFTARKQSKISVSETTSTERVLGPFRPLELTGISFSYGTHHILASADLTIRPGETIILTGASGAGKTTLAKIAAGLITPSGGKVSLPRNPGFLFQDDALLSHLDCFGNAVLPMRQSRKIDHKKVVDVLNLCGLGGHISHFPDELSGGLKKRLAFARALIHNPDFMILDEPFNNLDRDAREKLWDLYFELFAAHNVPGIIITHYPEELSRRDCIHYEISGGKIVKQRSA
ncbi:MAG TPA: ATP-binding cassette domain-containing protein, partial [Spirochaetota bacterium]